MPELKKKSCSTARLIAEIEGLKLTPASSQSKHYEEVNYGIDRVIEYLSNHYADSSATTTPYGYCPKCRGRGINRERRINGDDTCENGHIYPSKESTKQPMTDFSHTIQELIDFVDRNIHYEYGKRLRTSTAVQLLRDIEIDCNKLKAENDRLKKAAQAALGYFELQKYDRYADSCAELIRKALPPPDPQPTSLPEEGLTEEQSVADIILTSLYVQKIQDLEFKDAEKITGFILEELKSANVLRVKS